MSTGTKLKTINIVSIAVFSAIICVCSFITIPLPGVPVTLQIFGISAALLTLGGKKGCVSILLYILIGAVGLPVFSGFKGGIGVLFGATGGYILGFIPMGLIFLLCEKTFKGRTFINSFSALIAGLLLCYAFGTAQFCIVYLNEGKDIDIFKILSVCVFPFIIPDILKILIAFKCSSMIEKSAVGKDGAKK